MQEEVLQPVRQQREQLQISGLSGLRMQQNRKRAVLRMLSRKSLEGL